MNHRILSPSFDRGSRRAGLPVKRRTSAIDAGDQDRGRQHVLAEVVEGVEARREDALVEERPAAEGPQEGGQPLEDHLEVAEAEDQEAVEEDAVQQAGRGVLLEPLLAERVGEHRARALARVVGEDLVAARARVDEHADVPEPPAMKPNAATRRPRVRRD